VSKSGRVVHGLCGYLLGLVGRTEQVATGPWREGMAGKSQILHQVARLKKGGTFLTSPAQTNPTMAHRVCVEDGFPKREHSSKYW